MTTAFDLEALEPLWLEFASRAGFAVRRSDEAYAGYDGAGVILIGAPDSLDEDDCLAQLLLHELCHHLVQGPGSEHQLDWGLNNIAPDGDDVLRERATLRLQHRLLQPYGLDSVLGPTTEYRTFYASLGHMTQDEQPPTEEQALTRAGELWLGARPWRDGLEAVLQATAAQALRMDCGTCGACCREAFDVLEIFSDDPFLDRFPELVRSREGHYEMPRVSGHCPLLIQSLEQRHWRCGCYNERPMGCRQFTIGSISCVDARRRVGLQ